MKFAKRLEAEAVPEWRTMYIRYKPLKKLLKAILKQIGLAKATNSSACRLLQTYDEDKAFFASLYDEMNRISNFYKEREREAAKAVHQIYILVERFSENCHVSHSNHSYLRKARLDQISPATTTYESFHADASNEIITRSADAEMDPSPVSALLPTTPKKKTAKAKTKKAILEQYRHLELLKAYRLLNYTGFVKIMKKYDKITGCAMSASILEHVRGQSFWRSPFVDRLIAEIEEIYPRVFTDGNRHIAMRQLRLPDYSKKSYHQSALVGGMLLGIDLMLTGRILHVGTQGRMPASMMYAILGIGLPFLLAWLFAINMLIWQTYQINYRFVFEFNPRHNLHPCQYIKLVGIVSTAYLAFATIFTEGWNNKIIGYHVQPLICGILVMFILVIPGPILFLDARLWLLKTLGRTAAAPFYAVRFREFFIGDQLMSLTYFFQTIGLAFLMAANDHSCKADLRFLRIIPIARASVENGLPRDWLLTGVGMLPGAFRMLQSLRRWHDSKVKGPHLANALKYFLSILVFPLVALYRIHGKLLLYSGNRADFVGIGQFWYVSLVIAAIASGYALLWDFVMDWGLFQKNSPVTFLRASLMFPSPYYYYAEMMLNTTMRFAWMLGFFQYRQITPPLLGFLLAVIEVFRRTLWNIFRVEHEHVNNCRHLKATFTIALPFVAEEVGFESAIGQADLFYVDIEKQRLEAEQARAEHDSDDEDTEEAFMKNSGDFEYANMQSHAESMIQTNGMEE